MRPEYEVVHMRFGSHVYGTDLPESDQDFKKVFIPSGREILLGHATKVSRSTSTGDPLGKNTAEDIDVEAFSFSGYLKLLAQGQTVAVDMLFVPEEHILGDSFWWCVAKNNRDRLLSKQISGFVGYCKSQANKYGIKGSRMNAAREVVKLLKTLPQNKRLGGYRVELEMFCIGREHAQIVGIKQPGKELIPHLEVCGRKMAYTVKVREAVATYERLFDQYGARTRAAEMNEGVDWKALMHAVRIGQQAVELLQSGSITFPRPNAQDLLKIRTGQVPYKAVAEQIEESITDMATAAEASELRDEPDYELVERLILDAHREQIV